MLKKIFWIIFIYLFIHNVSFARNYYGAIYVDEKTGISGVVINHSNIESAKREALNECKRKSGKKYCEFINGWYNSCAAAAWSSKMKSARTGDLSDNQRKAESNALTNCQKKEGDRNCKIVATACTSWDINQIIFY